MLDVWVPHPIARRSGHDVRRVREPLEPDDGRVVSLDHGCGEHSQIEPPEPSNLWIQTKPAYDDMHIDIVAQSTREERGEVELLEEANEANDSGEADEQEAATSPESAETTESAE